MSKPYDALPKDLITEYPADWLAFAGPPNAGSVEVIDADVLKQLFQGVHLVSILEDSSAYVLIQAHYGKKLLLRQGRKCFGAPDQATLTALDAIIDPERLERMAERLLEATSWAELLATP